MIKQDRTTILGGSSSRDFKDFLQQSSQLIFLETDECLEDSEREFLKTFYKNNKAVFLITYQLWQKYSSGVFFV